MSINIKWNDDKTEATISKADLETLQNNFNNGFGKGNESGKKEGRAEVLKAFDFLTIDPDNIEQSIAPIKQQLLDIQAGKFPEELMKKVKDLDLVKDLQIKLQKKEEALAASESKLGSLKTSYLIDGKLLELGGSDKHKAVDARAAAQLFKSDYKIEIGEGDKVIIKNSNGNALFNDKGDELSLDDVFAKFSTERPYLFSANGTGGSGGGENNGGGGKTMKKSQFDSLSPKEQAGVMDQGTTLVDD